MGFDTGFEMGESVKFLMFGSKAPECPAPHGGEVG